jgi:uncharacterized protein
MDLQVGDPTARALIGAIQTGDVQGLHRLLTDSPALARVRVVDDAGVSRSLMHIVADWPGHFPNGPATVAVLARAGAPLSAPALNVSGGAAETALHWAASSDDVPVLDALLDHGADIEAPGAVITGGTALSDAVVFAQWRAARRLVERGAVSTLWQAAALGQLAELERLASAQPQPTGDQITNAFWHACRAGQHAAARLLQQLGADISWVGYDRRTPLDAAKSCGNASLVRWLEELNAASASSAS